MKTYYIISSMTFDRYKIFKDIIESLKSGESIEYFLSEEYFKKIIKEKNIDIRTGYIYEEIVSIKYLKENKDIGIEDIIWVYKEEMVIFNEDLYLYKNLNWEKINNEKINIISIRLGNYSPFWFLLDKLPNINFSFVNKRKKYRLNGDKLESILEIYKKREEYIGHFMLPLYNNKDINGIRQIFLLWKQLSGKNTFILKGSYASDNGKDIKLIEVDKIVERDDLLDYIYIKYISKVGYNKGSVFFTERYQPKKEYRFYVNRKSNTGQIDIYYVKHKMHLTNKEELLNKINIRTSKALKIRWVDGDLKKIDERFFKAISYIMSNIEQESGALEFIEDIEGNIRYLEINNLGGTLVFNQEFGEKAQNRFKGMLDNLIIE